jgi:hypothetical protein
MSATAAALLLRRPPGNAGHPTDRLDRCGQLLAHFERLGD